jgi:hypothetical protein
MSFKAYRATPFNHTHENNAFNKLHDFLLNHWGEQDEPLHLIGNFYVDGCEIDALIIKRNSVIVIDFKDYGGNLIFSENGRWKIDGKEVRGGNKTNPYHQIRDNKFQLLNYLKDQIDFQSSPNLGHIAGICLFHQNIEFDASTLSQNISRWFHITDMSSVIRTTDAIVSSKISFSNADIELMISKLDVPIYHPDGHPTEASIPTFEEGGGSETVMLNSEQTKALVGIKDWLTDTNNKVFSLAGAFYTGKTKVLESAVNEFVRNGKTPIFLAPNARIANRYKSRGFSDVSSIYSWLYAGRPNDIRNGKAVYPVDREPIDPDKDIIVIFESHLLGDDLFETETTVYGSGYTLRDLLNSLTGADSNTLEAQASLELTDLPKILLIGDPYQLTRGARDKSLLGCQIFEQRKVSSIRTELNSQDRDDLAPIEMLDFQSSLIGQIKALKFVQLPLCQQGSIKTIAKGEHTDSIAISLIKWPRRTAYLCSKNAHAQSVNNGIRKKYLGAHSLGLLTEGDIVDIHNRTPNLQVNEYEQTEVEWVSSGEFARVASSDAEIETKSITLKGRESPVSVDFALARIEYSGGTAEILYLPDFLSASKPELTQDQTIALQIWARDEAEKILANEKKKLELMDKEDDKFKVLQQQYNIRHNNLVMGSRYTNAARLRYAYALTVQAYHLSRDINVESTG